MNTSLQDLRALFFLEAEDLLAALEAGLRGLRDGQAGEDAVNAVFRAVHSIKGGAAAFGMNGLVAFAHRFETALDDLRCGLVVPDGAQIGLLLQAADHLADLVAADRDGKAADSARGQTLLTALDGLRPAAAPPVAAPPGGGGTANFVFDPLPLTALALCDEPAPTPLAQGYLIQFRPHAGVFARGHDPALILHDLHRLGDMAVRLDSSDLPVEGFDPGQCYLAWDITLTTDAPPDAISAVFDFVADVADVAIVPQAGPLPAPPAARATPMDSPNPDRAAHPPAEASAPETPPPPPMAAARPTIRVDIDRVDRLADILGELVIHQAMLTEAIAKTHAAASDDVDRQLDHLRLLSRQIQDSVMAIRAQPVKPLFDRMFRILREATLACGKQARLVTEGEMTEVDKTVIERLADPLTHMLRNAVDHGIEPPDARRRAGKPAEGTIHLSAEHRSGRILITLSDDGAGLDRARVREVAVARGLIAPQADLSATDIDALIFLPGFSTAKTVSALSGRGVGMDVVKSEITALGGRIAMQSTPGSGTTLTISLPLTLAVLDGMVVEVAGQTLVLPVASILETLRVGPDDFHPIGPSEALLSVRGQAIPMIDVARALGLPEPAGPEAGSIVVVVEQGEGRLAALRVDDIRDQRQVVIKGLDANYGPIPGIAAATVLGNGAVALILDPTDLAHPAPSFSPLAAAE